MPLKLSNFFKGALANLKLAKTLAREAAACWLLADAPNDGDCSFVQFPCFRNGGCSCPSGLPWQQAPAGSRFAMRSAQAPCSAGPAWLLIRSAAELKALSSWFWSGIIGFGCGAAKLKTTAIN